MANQPAAGDLTHRVQLQRRPLVDDGYGNKVPGGAFETQSTVWARLLPLRGGETVAAARLSGRQPYVLTVQQSSLTRDLDETWRVVDSRNQERIFAVTSPPIDPYGTRAFFDLLLTEGGPT